MSGEDFDGKVRDRSKRLKLGSGLLSMNDVIPNNIAKYLSFNIKGKVDEISDCITKLMLDDIDSQRNGVIELYNLVSQDPRINESDHLTSEAVRRLIEFLSPREDADHWGFPYYAALILGYAKNWGDVPKKDAVLPLKELISFKNEQLLAVGLHALALVACDFSTHQAILDCDMLESVAEIFHGDEAECYRIARHCAKFLSAFCSNNALSQEKKDACIGIIKDLFRCWENEEVMVPACYALFNLTKGRNVALENCVVEKLVFLTSLPDPYLIFPALEVLGNIVRWGDKKLIKVMIDNNIVLRLEGFLKSKNKIVQKEACWIISNIIAKSSKEIEESSLCKLIECLCFILKNDDESDVHMEAAGAIFSWYIDDVGFKEIIWPRRRGEASSIISVEEKWSYIE